MKICSAFKEASKKVKIRQQIDKKAYYDTYLSKCGSNTKKYWKTVNSVYLNKIKIVCYRYKNVLNLNNSIFLHNCADQAVGSCGPIYQVDEIKYLGVMLDSK